MGTERVEHAFVEEIPEKVIEGVLYISLTYATAIHLCCCGCGSEVVTPFSPARWRMTFDGETVSLAPSIGNWNYPCGSHYWIDRGRVLWSGRWSSKEIKRGQQRDEADILDWLEPAIPQRVKVWRAVVHRLVSGRTG